MDELSKAPSETVQPGSNNGTPESRRRRASQLPLRKVVSPRFWKLCSVGFLGLAVGFGILAGAWSAEKYAETLGPGFVRLFDLSASRLIAVYNTTLLLLCGQLSLVIWWVRSRSLKDFNGRYRVWAWNAVATFFLAFVMATDAHLAWTETFLWLRAIEFWNIRILCGLAPVVLCALVMLRWMYPEIRSCRASLITFLLAGICFAVAVETRLTKMLPIDEAFADLVSAGVLMLGHLCYFMCLLFHIRYVVYDSFDPPAARPSRFSLKLPRIRLLPRRKRGSEDRSKAADAPLKARNSSSSKHASAAGGDAANRDAGSAPSKSTVRSVRRKKLDSQTSDAGTRRLYDSGSSRDSEEDGGEPIDAELLKGLSKRERRKLRKQWREQQRASRPVGA